jgi:hypothetical protein
MKVLVSVQFPAAIHNVLPLNLSGDVGRGAGDARVDGMQHTSA